MRCLILLGLAVVAVAAVDDTPAGIDLKKLAHPALTKVRPGAVFDVAVSPHEVILSGKGKSGKTWTVHLCGTCFEEVWRGDLDGNGTDDYAITGSGPFNNTRKDPAFSLAILLMDADGMPVPFFTPLFHADAVDHLVQLDGKVRLLVPRYDEVPSDERVGPYCSGHWVTQAYGFTNMLVEEVRGLTGGTRFPHVRNWAYTHPECANHPIGFSGRAKVVEVRTTEKNAIRTKLLKRDETSLKLPIEPVEECASMFADAMVFDTAGSREVAFPNLQGDGQYRLADKIGEAAVELRGVHECTISLLWAHSNP